jgi:hypothetical protein
LTFDDLTAIEPLLLDVLREARDRAQVEGPYCAVTEYGRSRVRLRHLVGPDREVRHPILSQARALLVCEQALAEVLPKCRGHVVHRLVDGQLVPAGRDCLPWD